jgi:hypothetical protein
MEHLKKVLMSKSASRNLMEQTWDGIQISFWLKPQWRTNSFQLAICPVWFSAISAVKKRMTISIQWKAVQPITEHLNQMALEIKQSLVFKHLAVNPSLQMTWLQKKHLSKSPGWFSKNKFDGLIFKQFRLEEWSSLGLSWAPGNRFGSEGSRERLESLEWGFAPMISASESLFPAHL